MSYRVQLTTSVIAVTLLFGAFGVGAEEIPPGQPSFQMPPGGSSTFDSGDQKGPGGMMTPPGGQNFGSGGQGFNQQPPPNGGNMQNFQGQMPGQQQMNQQKGGGDQSGQGQGQDQSRSGGQGMGQGKNQGQGGGDQAAMQQKGMEKALKQAKNGAKGFEKQLANIKKRIASYKSKGVVIPTTLSDVITKADATLVEINAATDISSIEGPMGDLQDIGSTLSDELPKLEMASQLPKILKQVEKEYTRLKKAVDSQRKKLASVALDLSASIAELDSKVADIRTAIDAAKSPSADPAEAIQSIQDDAFSQFEDAWQLYGSLEAVKSIKTTLRKVQSQVKANDKILVKLKKDNSPDLADLQDLQDKLKAQIVVVTTASKGKDLGDLFDEMQTLGDIQNEFESLLTQSQDDGDVTNDTVSATNNFGVPHFGPPSGLPGSSVTDVKSLQGMRNMAPFMPNGSRTAPEQPQTPSTPTGPTPQGKG